MEIWEKHSKNTLWESPLQSFFHPLALLKSVGKHEKSKDTRKKKKKKKNQINESVNYFLTVRNILIGRCRRRVRYNWVTEQQHRDRVRNTGSIHGSGRSPGGGHGNPLQYSCLDNSMDRGVWQATIHKISDMTEMT